MEKNENGLRYFEGLRQIIRSRIKYYSDIYNYLPEFKAGMNSGKVMVAEVGHIKKEMAYFGDVINTAARIRSIGNEYQAKFLVSQNIVELFKGTPNFHFVNLGHIP